MQENIGSDENLKLFEDSIAALRADAYNVGAYIAWDSKIRIEYGRRINEMASELRSAAANGRITWAQAAQQASETRNFIMELTRARTSPVGLAIAQQIKGKGKTLNEVIDNKKSQLFGKNVDFNRLSLEYKNTVYFEVVRSSGKDRTNITTLMRRLSKTARGLVVMSLAMSVYTIASADNKVAATAREVTTMGAGIGGGVGGGALAGLLCGPGAPVCVGIGAFVGGALAAFGVAWLW